MDFEHVLDQAFNVTYSDNEIDGSLTEFGELEDVVVTLDASSRLIYLSGIDGKPLPETIETNHKDDLAYALIASGILARDTFDEDTVTGKEIEDFYNSYQLSAIPTEISGDTIVLLPGYITDKDAVAAGIYLLEH